MGLRDKAGGKKRMPWARTVRCARALVFFPFRRPPPHVVLLFGCWLLMLLLLLRLILLLLSTANMLICWTLRMS